MYQKLWKEKHASVCSINFYGSSSSKILGLTGFIIENYIVTDEIIYQPRNNCQYVMISFFAQDGYHHTEDIIIDSDDFYRMVPKIEDFDNLGIAMIPTGDIDELKNIKPLEFCRNCHDSIGRAVTHIGYQFEENTLSFNQGMISSTYRTNNNLSYLMYNSTIKAGMSGSPVLDLKTGLVVGVNTNRMLSISKSYQDIIKTVDQNLEILKNVEEVIDEKASIDTTQVLFATQNQLKQIARKFMTAMALKTGYALEISQVADFIGSFHEMDYELHNN